MAEGSRSPDAPDRLGITELEERFRELTLLMYDTSVDQKTLKERVHPYLAANIEFIDPFVAARGADKFKVGLAGFHCVFRFDFEIFQLTVELAEQQLRGRVLVDGVMDLRNLPFYTYPLRTFLVYDFVLVDDGRSFQITRQEEIWSFGDLLENAPLIGRLFNAWRGLNGYLFTGFFWLGCRLTGGLVGRPRYHPVSHRPERYGSAIG